MYGAINDGDYAAIVYPAWYTFRFVDYMPDLAGPNLCSRGAPAIHTACSPTTVPSRQRGRPTYLGLPGNRYLPGRLRSPRDEPDLSGVGEQVSSEQQ
jgi:hypothetical protein